MGTTLAFTLGVLSVLSALFLVASAWGIVWVFKLSEQQRDTYSEFERLWSELGRIEDRAINMGGELNNNIHERIDRMNDSIDHRFESCDRNMGEVIRHCESYCDSRVDKMSSKNKTLLKDSIN